MMSTLQFDEWENTDGEQIATKDNAAALFGVV